MENIDLSFISINIIINRLKYIHANEFCAKIVQDLASQTGLHVTPSAL